jgi:glycosyltransferase involved in cell wall biosynthesis
MNNFLLIHNEYSSRGGEESVVAFQKQLLEEHGHKVIFYTRKYDEMKKWVFGKYWGTFTSIFNPKSRRDLKKIIEKEKPDVALLHNLFPIISPSVIPFLKRKKIKVFQVVHNYRMLCPIGLFYHNGEICEKCTGKGKEWNCVKNRCNKGFLGSFSFFLRAYFTRKLGYYNHVDAFLSLTNFQKNKLVANGFDANKIIILPNSFKANNKNEKWLNEVEATNIGFIGRLTHEKGLQDFIEIAKKMPHQQFLIAGDNSNITEDLLLLNVTFLGLLSAEHLPEFYKKCKVILFLSKLYEGFPMILLESMSYGVPVIVYNLAAMPEIIENNKEGFVVEIEDFENIIEKINQLFQDQELYHKLSLQCVEKFAENFSSEKYYERLLEILNFMTFKQFQTF